MDIEEADGLPHIDSSLDPIRAAIRLVADGDARRVTVHTPASQMLMPAARQLAKAAGVRVELIGSSEAGDDLAVVPVPNRSA
jgi:hypothetical protein